MAEPPKPLAGLRVLEVANWVAAPSCGALFADLGAEVVKVEAPGGCSMRYTMGRQAEDPATGRAVPPGARFDYAWNLVNRGKRSVCCNLNVEEGQEIVRTLARDCDVFLTNLTPSRLEKYRLGPEHIRGANPRCVYTLVTGWGIAGPAKDNPGFDMTAFFARGGFMASHQQDPDRIQTSRPAIGDFATGLAVAFAVLAALRLRDRTGSGTVVDASLFRTSAWIQGADMSSSLVDGKAPPAPPRTEVPNPMVNTYRTGCGRWIMFCMPFPRYWPALCEAVGRPEWVQAYPRPEDRRRAAADLISMLSALFASRTLEDWREVLDRHKLNWSPCASLAEVVQDPQHAAIGTFAQLRGPHGDFRTVAAPFSIHAAEPHGPAQVAPEPGEHTAAELRRAGLSDEQVHGLVSKGVVGFSAAAASPALRRWVAKGRPSANPAGPPQSRL